MCYIYSCNITAIGDGELSALKCLRTLNLSRNNLETRGVPPDIFDNEELNTLDLSHNKLTAVPDGVCKAKSTLVVLNLSHNNLEMIPRCGYWHSFFNAFN